MPVFLVRHGKAGSRHDWRGPDELRPLSKKGRRQAEGLVTLIGHEPVSRVVSSPYLRCVQTVEPLAAKLGLEVEQSEALSEGAGAAPALALADEAAGAGATWVLCSHGDVIPALLGSLAARDGLPLPPEPPFAKGSTWVLEEEEGRYARASYLRPGRS